MHPEVLNSKQRHLLPFLRCFKKDFLLIGGTALALYLGHRKSIDFDLITHREIEKGKIDKQIKKNGLRVETVFISNLDEYTLVMNGVKCTFLYYPFPVMGRVLFNNIILLPTLLELAAMKAYTLGRRGTWKDYIDLYFLLKDRLTLQKIVQKAKKIFGKTFNEKLFRGQLCYFEDVNLNEKIDFVKKSIKTTEIQKFLCEVALT